MITQKIDADDAILGVYHEWARHIVKSFEKLSIICLYKGRVDLPANINIFSLGKEKVKGPGGSAPRPPILPAWLKGVYLFNFYKYILGLRNNYDAVFVHMNPVYVILGFVPWRIMGKKIFMWYAHPEKNALVKTAYFLCDKVITSVPEAFYARGKTVVAIGQGIDTELFSPSPAEGRGGRRLLYLGRISPAKRTDTFLEAAKMLKDEGVKVSVSIVGDPSETYSGKEYYQKLKEFVAKNGLTDTIAFLGSMPNREVFKVYNQHSIFINLSPTGYFDKTVLEAMACERVVLASNEAYKHVFPHDLLPILMFEQDNVLDLAEKIKVILALAPEERAVIGRELRKVVTEHHSLSTFGDRLRQALQ